MKIEKTTGSPEQTIAFGTELARELGHGRAIALESQLGGGKTVLAKGIALGLGVGDPDIVTSPTFTLVNCYMGEEGEIYHIDLYRLASSREAADIGIEELLSSGCTVIIEWAERIRDLLDDDTVWVRLDVVSTHERRISVAGPDEPVRKPQIPNSK